MVTTKSKPKLVAIVGPTASGKSDLAIKGAKDFSGEIIAADSLTVYKNMDIGTAKPTKADQAAIKHWAIDIIGPGERFTAAEFKHYAQKSISDITARGKLPIVVGGTGLYADALLYDFSFVSASKAGERQKLEHLTLEQLQGIIKSQGYDMPTNQKNRRHLIGTIERKGEPGRRTTKLPEGVILVGIVPPELKSRIGLRVEKMFDDGIIEETKELLKFYGRDSILAKAKVAYGPVIQYLADEFDLTEAKSHLKTAHWQYARRQKTWFKRNSEINWFSSPEAAYKFIKKQLLNT